VAEQRLRLDDYIAIIRRRKWQAIVPAFILFVIATLAALLIPPTYRSTASLLIEPQEIPPEPVRADQRIQVIGQRVMTTSNLSTLIERYDLYPDIHRREGIQMAVEEMRKHIKLHDQRRCPGSTEWTSKSQHCLLAVVRGRFGQYRPASDQ